MLTLDDYLVLYTDGVTEARRRGKMYGEAQLVKTVADLRGLSAQELAEGLLQEVGNYADKLADDIQIVALRLARRSAEDEAGFSETGHLASVLCNRRPSTDKDSDRRPLAITNGRRSSVQG